MKLLIVESPNKVASISKYLGDGWKVIASVGHVRDLPQKELGVDLESFELDYQPSDRGQQVLRKIKQAAADANEIYLATDPDREGEAIAWHVLDAAGLPKGKTRRVTFNAIEKSAILAAVAKPRDVDMHLVHAQEARRALDRLVGYVVSPALCEAAQQRLSAGRVQSPAVRLVVEREAQIRGFREVNHFGAILHVDGWTATWDTKPHLQGSDYILDESLAKQAAACRSLRVISSQKKRTKERPPAPFSTSTLLQAASVSLKLDPDATMKLAQSLFEQGLITYHRSDAQNLSEDSVATIRKVLADLGQEVPADARKFPEKDDAQAAHEAIRPTSFDADVLASLQGNELALYTLIRSRALASQAADAQYDDTALRLEGEGGFQFIARGREPVNLGWRKLGEDASQEADENADDADNGKVPELAEGTAVTAKSGEVVAKKTKPATRYTQAALVKKLEALGIGRPSTYAAILKNVMERGYIVESKRKLEATPLGIALIKTLVKAQCGFVEYDFTRKLEAELDAIAEGKQRYRDVIAPAYGVIAQDAERTRAAGVDTVKTPCPKCKEGFMRRINGSKGVFWACSLEACKHTMDDKGGQPVERQSYPCPDCGKPMYRRKGGSGFFWGCSGFADGCKVTLPDAKGKPGKRVEVSAHACPKCGKGLINRVKPSRGKAKGFNFWGCSGFPACDFKCDDAGGKPKV